MTHHLYRSRLIAGIALSLAFSGCLEIETTTRVASDGTLCRIQVANEKSIEDTHGLFPSEIDSLWTVVKGDSSGVKASRLFSSPEEFNRALDDTLNPRVICVHASLEKHFKGFFEELTYRETVRRYSPFGGPLLDNFVSPEEIKAIRECRSDRNGEMTHADSVAAEALNERFMVWMGANNRATFDAYCSALSEGVRMLHDPTLQPEDIAVHAQTVFDQCSDMSYSSGNIWRLDSTFQAILKSPKVKEAIAANAQGFAVFRSKLDVLDWLVYSWDVSGIEMPGIIVATNARTIEGNKAIWKDIGFAVWVTGADLWVTSRVLNWWAVGGTAFLVLLSITLTVVVWLRKRRSGF